MINLFIYIALMLFINYLIIVVDKKSPIHWLNGLMTCIVVGILSYIDPRPAWFTIPTFFITYEYLFSTGLNKLRHLELDYIGKTSVIDRLQRWALGNDENKFFMLFTMKAILAIGLMLCYKFNF